VQTSVHNDTVTIVATDVAGNKAEQLITVSVKIFARGFVINGIVVLSVLPKMT
jgi:hypothetical protein